MARLGVVRDGEATVDGLVLMRYLLWNPDAVG